MNRRTIVASISALALVAGLAACTTDPSQPVPTDSKVQEVCGPRPLAPGYAVAFEGGKAVMSSVEYAALDAWRDDVSVWAGCAADL